MNVSLSVQQKTRRRAKMIFLHAALPFVLTGIRGLGTLLFMVRRSAERDVGGDRGVAGIQQPEFLEQRG